MKEEGTFFLLSASFQFKDWKLKKVQTDHETNLKRAVIGWIGYSSCLIRPDWIRI